MSIKKAGILATATFLMAVSIMAIGVSRSWGTCTNIGVVYTCLTADSAPATAANGAIRNNSNTPFCSYAKTGGSWFQTGPCGSGTSTGTNGGDQTGGTPAIVLGSANTAGSSTNFLRRDDTILAFDATNPAALGTAGPGSATVAARRDHVHQSPTTVSGNAGTVTNATFTTGLTVNTGTVTLTGNAANTSVLTLAAGASSIGGANTGDQTGGTPAVTLGTANTAGSSTNFIRRDDTILAFDATAPTSQAFSDSAAVGSATVAARRDHKHAMMAAPTTVSGSSGSTVAAATFTTTGGAAAGATFNGSTARTIDYSTVGAAAASHNNADTTVTFTDNTAGNVSTTAHGYFPKVAGSPGQFVKVNAGGTGLDYATISGGGDMLGANNLSDVISAPSALANLLGTFTGQTLKAVRVNAGETDLEYYTPSAGGSGDVVGPASATGDTLAVWNGATGKLLKDGGPALSNVALANQSNTFTGLQTVGTLVATAGSGFSYLVVLTTGTSASWAVPAALQVTGAKWRVRCVGGGGGGGGSNVTAGMVGGGGASGGVGTKHFTYVAGQNTMTYSVGSAGSAGATNAAGGTGGASSVIYNSVTYTASGGIGGPSGGTAAAGAAGGACTGWDLNIPGQAGTPSGTMAATNNLTGNGAGTPLGYGGGGQEPFTAAGAVGIAATGYGAGGSGGKSGTGTTARTGGLGTAGLIIIEY